LSKRLKGLEPSTFCMASRRSSQLSYSREVAEYIPVAAAGSGSGWGAVEIDVRTPSSSRGSRSAALTGQRSRKPLDLVAPEGPEALEAGLGLDALGDRAGPRLWAGPDGGADDRGIALVEAKVIANEHRNVPRLGDDHRRRP